MQKYFTLFLLSWQNGFVYRMSVFLWRLRQVLSTVMALTVWSVLFASESSLFGYARSEMVTYIFLISVLQSFILTTSLQGLANTIYSGSLSFVLLKPVNVFYYLFSDDIADKSRNVLFIMIESLLLYFLFLPQLIIPSFPTFIIFIMWLIGGILLHFFIMLIFGSVGFWSPDTWGPRFLFYMFVDFTAGKLFPLDILPSSVQRVIAFTPFPYLSFWQSQLFLEKLAPSDIVLHSAGLLFWVGLTSLIAITVWKKGIKDYNAAGQ